MLIREYLRGNSSPWKAYLDVLPREFNTPMFWNEQDVAELQASSVVSKIGRAKADAMLRNKVVSVVRANEGVFFPKDGTARLDDEELLALAHRMGSAIMAYAFDLDKEDDDSDDEEEDGWVEDREGRSALGMVPMADMLNADAEFNAHINHGEGNLTAVALRLIQAGEEIFNYYGPLSNGELLRRYGYVTERHSRYDVVELPWSLVEARLRTRLSGGQLSDAEWSKAAKLFAEEKEEEEEEDEEGEEESFVLERESGEPDATGKFQGEAVFTGLPEELGERVKAFLKAVKKATSGGANASVGESLSDKTVRKEIYLESVLGALVDREAQYPTKLEDDEQQVGSLELTGRRHLAVCVRTGEKRLLREAQAWVRRELETIHAESSSRPRDSRERQGYEDAPSAKRRRT